jgi:uncharacterized protein
MTKPTLPLKGKIRTMEVRDVIHGPIELYPWEMAVIDSPAFQRLRNIKQLGFSEFAYPCAVHNRYVHSIGACHMGGMAFQAIFRNHFFSQQEHFHNFFYLVRACALLHDIGHGPFSHAIESAMPSAKALELPHGLGIDLDRQATHEDYTLKILLDSPLTPILEKEYSRFGITPRHLAEVMNLAIPAKDNFFSDRGVNFRKIFHQIISSEIDVDRMDYLQRDSYFTGVSYGKFDANWLLSSLTIHIEKKVAHLALHSRGLYTFEDFLLSRYHMFLMVYLHHKSVCYEKMMERYLSEEGCTFQVPAKIEDYLGCDDSVFYEYLRKDSKTSEWAQRILLRKNYKVALELHESRGDPSRSVPALELKAKLKGKGIPFLEANSGKGLSNYVRPNLSSGLEKAEDTIFVISDPQGSSQTVSPLEEAADVFRRYAEKKCIYRIYLPEGVKEGAL